jgi:hypothetical protein
MRQASVLIVTLLWSCGSSRETPKPLLGSKSQEFVDSFESNCAGQFRLTEIAVHCTLSGLKAYMVAFDERAGGVRRITIDFHDSDDDILKTFDSGLAPLFQEPTRSTLRSSTKEASTGLTIEGRRVHVVQSTNTRDGRAYRSIMWSDNNL